MQLHKCVSCGSCSAPPPALPFSLCLLHCQGERVCPLCVPLATPHPAGTFLTPCAGPGTAVPRVPRLPGGLRSVPAPLVPSTPKPPIPNGPGPAAAAPAASVWCQLSSTGGHAGSNRMEPGVASPCGASFALRTGTRPLSLLGCVQGVAVLEPPRGCPLVACWSTGL